MEGAGRDGGMEKRKGGEGTDGRGDRQRDRVRLGGRGGWVGASPSSTFPAPRPVCTQSPASPSFPHQRPPALQVEAPPLTPHLPVPSPCRFCPHLIPPLPHSLQSQLSFSCEAFSTPPCLPLLPSLPPSLPPSLAHAQTHTHAHTLTAPGVRLPRGAAPRPFAVPRLSGAGHHPSQAIRVKPSESSHPSRAPDRRYIRPRAPACAPPRWHGSPPSRRGRAVCGGRSLVAVLLWRRGGPDARRCTPRKEAVGLGWSGGSRGRHSENV